MAAVGLVAFSCTFPDYRFEPEPAETCHNDISDGNETGIDCGGDCDPCPCQDDEDCLGTDEVCEEGDCHGPCENGCPPSCTDKEKNGDEGGVDCGGSCVPRCEVGDACNVGLDCTEGVCAGDPLECQPPACNDGVLNGTEPAKDCGGECIDKCANSERCNVDEDCESDTCVNGRCVREFCDNDVQDEEETDVDCGGDTECARCNVDKMCEEGRDCIEGVCVEGECARPECDDEVENGNETDLDCGGGCGGCDDGQICEEAADCVSQVCELPSDCGDEVCTEKECQEPACTDGVKNGTETDEDCGGDCDGCELGEECGDDRDCISDICDLTSDAPVCVSCSDEDQNGSELGTDCGGEDCALCQPGDECTADAGCVNYLCDGECVTGLRADYHCGQCGQWPDDQIKAFVRLNNESEQDIDVSDVVVRYYFSIDVPDAVLESFELECQYMGQSSCGSQGLHRSDSTNPEASHYFETTIGSGERIPGNGSAELAITIRLNGTDVDQGDDYSFEFGMEYHVDWELITLHRQGSLIWGREP